MAIAENRVPAKWGALMIISILALSGCAQNFTRNLVTLDTGLPMSEGLQSYDVIHYTLRHDIQIDRKAIAGSATIQFKTTRELSVLELDFDGEFRIDNIADEGGQLEYRSTETKLFITFPKAMNAGVEHEVTVHYHGRPLEASNAPWEGGFVWSKTPSGKPWIATAIQGEGCDVWWPCKDHPTGEPKSLDLYFTVPGDLTVATNGVLVDVTDAGNGRKTFHWRTDVATNIYGVALNVAPYVLIEDSYVSSNGTRIPLMFWAIEEHEDDARALFDREFKQVLEFYERKVGPYPWGQEKLGVAETPHLGMEHQTINAYGNEFRRGDYGFDWLFHHELAHEWFGNVMTQQTNSDIWLHEGFGAFMQPQYTREILGDAAFHAAMYKSYLGIRNCHPIAPREEFSDDRIYDETQGGPEGDIYVKGTWVLHSLQYLIGDAAFWRSVRRLVYDTVNPETLPVPIAARHRSTDDYLAIASDEAGMDLSWFFEVYLRQATMPELEVTDDGSSLTLKWITANDLPFPMPIPVRIGGQLVRVEFTSGQAVVHYTERRDVQIDPFLQVLKRLPGLQTCEEAKLKDKKT